uniref:Phosphoglucomutase-2 n=1 Tax=Clastoptera arizonana TaxID=38151 RepID=A0A1B6E2I8_9HEMI
MSPLEGIVGMQNINTGNKELDDNIRKWFSWNQKKTENEEIILLLKQNDLKGLSKLLNQRMEFGTAGLRGRMGPGFSQMNDLVIIQTGQGLLKYLSENEPDLKNKGVVIGFDGRHNSKRFAELTAAIFHQAGVRVNLHSNVCPTPFIPFAVLHCNHAAGVMVTASHNPKEDNGYKVYWKNGAQIKSPTDKGIQKCILESLQPKLNYEDTASVWNLADDDSLNDAMKEYYERIKKSVFNFNTNSSCLVKITYTAMHGVGYPFIKEAFKIAKFPPVIPVAEQVEPDPEFPTVKFPNPEEGKSALNLSIKTANENGSQIILANDPDADRLAVAEKSRKGEWKVFSGNELGALLGWWSIYTYKQKNPSADLSKVYMLSSTVSSKILKSISKKEGFQFEETLTGFKWMGNRSSELLGQDKTVLFAFEEAIGFMCGTAVLDKDGVSAAVKIAELAAFLQKDKLTLTEKLADIYAIYGQHVSDNSYFVCHEPPVIERIFTRLRSFNGTPNSYPSELLDGKYNISGIRDLTTGYDSSQPDKKATLPVSRTSEMITFTFDNGLVATLRTSGTEPKIKYYTELCAPPEIQDLDQVKAILKEMVGGIIEEYFQPRKNKLIYRSE